MASTMTHGEYTVRVSRRLDAIARAKGVHSSTSVSSKGSSLQRALRVRRFCDFYRTHPDQFIAHTLAGCNPCLTCQFHGICQGEEFLNILCSGAKLTNETLAKILNVTSRQVSKMRKSGELPAGL